MNSTEQKVEIPSISVVFPTEMYGWWEGRIKEGVFTPSLKEGGYDTHPDLEVHIKWDCYELNHWFRTPYDPNNPAGAALKKLRSRLSKTVPGTQVELIKE